MQLELLPDEVKIHQLDWVHFFNEYYINFLDKSASLTSWIKYSYHNENKYISLEVIL